MLENLTSTARAEINFFMKALHFRYWLGSFVPKRLCCSENCDILVHCLKILPTMVKQRRKVFTRCMLKKGQSSFGEIKKGCRVYWHPQHLEQSRRRFVLVIKQPCIYLCCASELYFELYTSLD